MMLKTALFVAAAALATAATAAPVLAKDVVVRYGDLDLATAEGQHAFAHRIDRAAKAACDYHSERGIPSQDAIRCYRQARTNATTQMASLVENSRLGG